MIGYAIKFKGIVYFKQNYTVKQLIEMVYR